MFINGIHYQEYAKLEYGRLLCHDSIWATRAKFLETPCCDHDSHHLEKRGLGRVVQIGHAVFQ